ncbi:MAG: LysE family transporter [Bacteriovorax sp.]|jgi:threonine/homoserine/homoserine lactone efflux protein
MITALIIGILTGFLICIPVGPINVWVVNTLIRHNFRSAFSIALGGSLMDFIYFIVILSGLSLFNFSGKTVLVLKICGVFFLFAFGLKELLVKNQKFEVDPNIEKKIPHVAGFFLMGVGIYSSNPTLVASMSAIAAVIKSWNLFAFNLSNNLSLSAGLALGSASWFYLLLKIVKKYQNRIPEKLFINFSRASGALIVIFSLYMAFNVYKENFV